MTTIVFQVHHLGALGFDGDCATCGKHACPWLSQNCSTSTIICINEVTIKNGTCQAVHLDRVYDMLAVPR